MTCEAGLPGRVARMARPILSHSHGWFESTRGLGRGDSDSERRLPHMNDRLAGHGRRCCQCTEHALCAAAAGRAVGPARPAAGGLADMPPAVRAAGLLNGGPQPIY